MLLKKKKKKETGRETTREHECDRLPESINILLMLLDNIPIA